MSDIVLELDEKSYAELQKALGPQADEVTAFPTKNFINDQMLYSVVVPAALTVVQIVAQFLLQKAATAQSAQQSVVRVTVDGKPVAPSDFAARQP